MNTDYLGQFIHLIQKASRPSEKRTISSLPLFQHILLLFALGCVLGTVVAELASLITKQPWEKLNSISINLFILLLSIWYRHRLHGTPRTIFTIICVFSLFALVCNLINGL